jgi:hypothetical protein
MAMSKALKVEIVVTLVVAVVVACAIASLYLQGVQPAASALVMAA